MMSRWPIRWRLTAWYGGVLAVVLTTFGTAVYFVMRHQLMERIDAGLSEELADVLSEVKRAADREEMMVWLNRRFAQHAGFDFQITDDHGNLVFTNPRLGTRKLPLPDAVRESAASYRSDREPGSHDARIVSRRATGPDGPVTIQVARSLADFNQELSRLLLVLAVTGPIALAVALSGGYWLARRALEPVESMRRDVDKITAQQLTERLAIPNEHDELGRLATTLNQMLDRLEASFRELQRFTADASHELRTPLAVIRSEAEVAMRNVALDSTKQEVLGSILEECERLTWITDQLLTLSREDAGASRVANERVDLTKIAAEVADHMRILADSKGLTLRTDLPASAMVSGDPVRLRHVVYNLLDNAIKYTPSGGNIQLTVSANGQGSILTVTDTGTGIPGEDLPHVFKRFYRVDKVRSRSQGGAGLGLSIVHSIVHAHGGQISLSSEPGKGTTLIVRLPKS
jgi:heavy metal sensor kinase